MENNDKIAEIRHAHRQLPDILYAIFKIIFSLISLKFFCTSAVGREETTGYWIDRAEELMHNDSIDEAISACGMALKKECMRLTRLFDWHNPNRFSIIFLSGN